MLSSLSSMNIETHQNLKSTFYFINNQYLTCDVGCNCGFVLSIIGIGVMPASLSASPWKHLSMKPFHCYCDNRKLLLFYNNSELGVCKYVLDSAPFKSNPDSLFMLRANCRLRLLFTDYR